MTPKNLDAKVVAEIGCNHMGQLELAKDMIAAAARAGAWCVKFQKRDPKSCLTPAQYEAPYDSPNSFGRTYGEHRERLEFTIEQHRELLLTCVRYGVKYSTSVWDLPSLAEALVLHGEFPLAFPYVKIPSAKNEDFRLLEAADYKWPTEVHISNGMIGREEEKDIVDFLQMKCVMYACTSSYPSEHKDVKILDVPRLLKYPIRSVGFSGHHKGIALDVAAAALGAEFIERHFTLDRTWKGTDQAASLEPEGLRRLCRDLRALGEAWDIRYTTLPAELPVRKKLKGA